MARWAAVLVPSVGSLVWPQELKVHPQRQGKQPRSQLRQSSPTIEGPYVEQLNTASSARQIAGQRRTLAYRLMAARRENNCAR